MFLEQLESSEMVVQSKSAQNHIFLQAMDRYTYDSQSETEVSSVLNTKVSFLENV